MQITRAALKKMSKDQLRGNWLWAIGLSIVPLLLSAIINDLNRYVWSGQSLIDYLQDAADVLKYNDGFRATSLIINLLVMLISWGVIYSILAFRDNGQKPNIFKAMFSAYTNGYLKETLLTGIMINVFTTLWTFLFVIPGIIKGYSYALTPYIMKDMIDSDYKMSITEAITQSRKEMNGHKLDLFVLDLSFIGWWLLGIITIGIGFIWIIPYYRQTKANFYRSLVGDKYIKTANEADTEPAAE